jgi:hypothetical protein
MSIEDTMAELRRIGWGDRDKRADNPTRQARRNEIVSRLLNAIDSEMRRDFDNSADAFILTLAVIMSYFPPKRRDVLLRSIDTTAELIATGGQRK